MNEAQAYQSDIDKVLDQQMKAMKMAEEDRQRGMMAGMCGTAPPVSGIRGVVHRRTQREEAQYRMENATTEAQRAARAVSFFAEHPEFDEFIQLVRAGAIQI